MSYSAVSDTYLKQFPDESCYPRSTALDNWKSWNPIQLCPMPYLLQHPREVLPDTPWLYYNRTHCSLQMYHQTLAHLPYHA